MPQWWGQSVLIDLREKIKNSLTRAKLRNSLAEEREGIQARRRIPGASSKREKFSTFSSRCRIASLCHGIASGNIREKTNIEQQKAGGDRSPLPTQVSPCVSASAYGNECQCSSRKHDLGWNNPFGKGPRSSLFVSLLHCISFSLFLLLYFSLFDFLRVRLSF